jgi:hypothetical protein
MYISCLEQICSFFRPFYNPHVTNWVQFTMKKYFDMGEQTPSHCIYHCKNASTTEVLASWSVKIISWLFCGSSSGEQGGAHILVTIPTNHYKYERRLFYNWNTNYMQYPSLPMLVWWCIWASNYCFLAFGCIGKRFSVEEASTNLCTGIVNVTAIVNLDRQQTAVYTLKFSIFSLIHC